MASVAEPASDGCVRCCPIRRSILLRRLLDLLFDHLVDPLIEVFLLEHRRFVYLLPHVLHRRVSVVRARHGSTEVAESDSNSANCPTDDIGKTEDVQHLLVESLLEFLGRGVILSRKFGPVEQSRRHVSWSHPLVSEHCRRQSSFVMSSSSSSSSPSLHREFNSQQHSYHHHQHRSFDEEAGAMRDPESDRGSDVADEDDRHRLFEKDVSTHPDDADGGAFAHPLEKYTRYLCYVFGDDPDVIRLITSFSSTKHMRLNSRPYDAPLFLESGGLFGFNRRSYRIESPLERSVFEILQRMHKLDFYPPLVEQLRKHLGSVVSAVATLERVAALRVSPTRMSRLFADLLTDFDRLFKQFCYFYFMNLDEATIRSWFAFARSSFDTYETEVLLLFKNIRESLVDCCGLPTGQQPSRQPRAASSTVEKTDDGSSGGELVSAKRRRAQ